MNPKSRQSVFCTNIRVEQKQTVLYYQPEARRPFLRVGLATPNLVPQTRSESLTRHCLLFCMPSPGAKLISAKLRLSASPHTELLPYCRLDVCCGSRPACTQDGGSPWIADMSREHLMG